MTAMNFTPTSFPATEGVAASSLGRLEWLQELHESFMGQWRQALLAIVPAAVDIQLDGLEIKSYTQYVLDAPAVADIQVFEIEAMQSLCAWAFDVYFVSTSVDCMFGGAGRIPVRDAHRRGRTPIEVGVRRRLLESMATAYESVWQSRFPIRLQPLRQEQKRASLRLSAPSDLVVHASFKLQLNQTLLWVDACIPKRALEALHETRNSDESVKITETQPESALPHALHSAPVELVAVLAHTQLSVAQLMALSIGQVIPLKMNESVPLSVDGVRLVAGQNGVRNGKHAVRIENIHVAKMPFEAMDLNGNIFQKSDDSVSSPTAHGHSDETEVNVNQQKPLQVAHHDQEVL